MKSILITDSLFILPEHEQKLRNAGFEITRLDKPQATEDELIEAIKGKDGYILGGIEKVTSKIIDASDKLKIITFTGIDYKALIPGWERAMEKGIAISNTPNAPSHAVSEWAVTVALAMNRGIFDIGRTGVKDFLTTDGLEGLHIGIIGLGRVGKAIIEKVRVFEPATISYTGRTRHEEYSKLNQTIYKTMKKLLSESDVIFLCVAEEAGINFIGKNELALLKSGALFVSSSHAGLIDEDALLSELQSARIRIAVDYPLKQEGYKDIPLNIAFFSNGQNAFNTHAGIKRASDIATESIINILNGRDDQYLIK
jgi:phosphoglycerate dehydrogenase-like enzyme